MLFFIDREQSWLDFNFRVLEEAERGELPLLERLKFLAISDSNLDEFFMVRIPYLRDKRKEKEKGGNCTIYADEQLDKVLSRIKDFKKRQNICLKKILHALNNKNVCIKTMESLSEEQYKYAHKIFESEVYPVITPLAVDSVRPFPLLSNKSLSICIHMKNKKDSDFYSIIEIPTVLPRFIKIPSEAGYQFLPLEELVAHNLPVFCTLHSIVSYGYFKLLRSADYDAGEEENLLLEMKRTIKKRRHGKPVCLEFGSGFDKEMKYFLTGTIGIDKKYIFKNPSLIGINDYMELYKKEDLGFLRSPPFIPAVPISFAEAGEDIFTAIKKRDRFLHHPYESFDCVVDFIRKAASDPDVIAVKQTLYRVSSESMVIRALEDAAEAGKQVTVIVELKARFDEENNIKWADRLERAGCHVIYGFEKLKVHCKITLVIRREQGAINQYLHLSTGNYNDETAKLYTDFGIFTCRSPFGSDASALFNFLTGYSLPPKYNKFITAPEMLRSFLNEKIDLEISNAENGIQSGISIKINSLADIGIIKKLCKASEAGVKIRLIVRGICSLLPGIPGMSENIRVRSIIGRFLEHSRLYIFENGGEPLIYTGSVDLLPRNLERRIELIFPVEDNSIKDRLKKIFELMWHDNEGAWDLSCDGIYRRAVRENKKINSQLTLSQNTHKKNEGIKEKPLDFFLY